ncbi:MAG: nucleotide exchange factor GrpE [Sulfobacillus sp.]
MWPFSRRQHRVEAPPRYEQELLEAMTGLSEQVNKLIRWSYRTQKTETETLQKLQAQLDAMSQDRNIQLHSVSRTLEQLSDLMIAWLDDLDALTKSSNPAWPQWDSVLSQWVRQLQRGLAMAGFEEIAIDGKPFDPRLAEALGTVDDWDGSIPPHPYQVISVLRRGYVRDSQVYRKAQVMVFKGELESGN